MPRTDISTIKVPVELRARISEAAHSEGKTAAAFLSTLLAKYEREQRMAAVGRSYRENPPDAEYWAESQLWQETTADGLDGA